MKQLPFSNFTRKHPVLANSIMAFIVVCVGIYAIFLFLDIFTDHGTEIKVPDVRNIPKEKAIERIEDVGLDYEIDSVYDEGGTPGIVIEQTPLPNSMVKSTRIVVITVNMMEAPKKEIPADLLSQSGADGRTCMEELGFLHVKTDTVPSAEDGLIVAIKVDGHNVVPGQKVAVNRSIILSIGDGSMDVEELHPLSDRERDSLIQDQISKGMIRLTTDSAGRQVVVIN